MEGREKPMVFFAFLSSGDIDGATLTFSCWARGTVTVLLLFFLVNIVVLFFFSLLGVGELHYFIRSVVSRTTKPWLLAVLINHFQF